MHSLYRIINNLTFKSTAIKNVQHHDMFRDYRCMVEMSRTCHHVDQANLLERRIEDFRAKYGSYDLGGGRAMHGFEKLEYWVGRALDRNRV